MAEVRSPGSPLFAGGNSGRFCAHCAQSEGMTVDQVAAELLCSPSKVSRMETGQRGATATGRP